MGIEAIIGAIAVIISLVAAAFGIGHSRGKTKAETKAEQQRTEEGAASVKAAADRRVEATKGASDVQQTVSHLPDDDVNKQLRDKWTR
ncbi:hypothetical protein ACQK5W_04180 [Pantoea sp. FN060301]|uniref:hypothetical protein n=1 Tax=Pantoea sp. FN060301 TaxID=3420380 RepID=UPI003D17EA77